jgi:hypothetical protein
MCVGFSVWGEECGMEYRVYFSLFWEFQSMSEWPENFGDSKGAFSFWGYLLALVSEFQVFRFQPNLVILLEWFELASSSFCHLLSW